MPWYEEPAFQNREDPNTAGLRALERVSHPHAREARERNLAWSRLDRYAPAMAKGKEAPPVDERQALVVRYVESPNSIVVEGPVLEQLYRHGDLLDLVVKRPGTQGKLTLYGVPPLDPKRTPPVYPTWHQPSTSSSG